MPLDAIKKVIARQNLSREEAYAAAEKLMQGAASSSQIAALLVGLRMKGETVEEVAGFAAALREHVVSVSPRKRPLLDTCGTGGSQFRVFNVSTCAAFVAATAGVGVAKHGNRAVTGICGSADVLEALGIPVNLPAESIAECIDTIGVGFLFAPSHHPAMRHVGPTRREIGIRTLFNLVGPLTNPAGATRQLMGVYSSELVPLAAGTLRELGSERAIVAHGLIGLDEISLIGPTRVQELLGSEIQEYELTPASFGIKDSEPDPKWLAPADIPSGNAKIVLEVLSGLYDTPERQARLKLVAINAAAALRVSDLAEDWQDAYIMACEILFSGKALQTLERLREYANLISTERKSPA